MTGTGALDFVLGNDGGSGRFGVVQGSLTAVCGGRRVGRSTLVMQVAHDLAWAYHDPCKVLVVTARANLSALRVCQQRVAREETQPTEQFTMQDVSSVMVAADYAHVLRADVLVIDDMEAFEDGHAEQATRALALLRSLGLTVFVVCSREPPLVLPRVADVVLQLEAGEADLSMRTLRSLHNLHAPLTSARMQMTSEGLISQSLPARGKARDESPDDGDDGDDGSDDGSDVPPGTWNRPWQSELPA